MYSINDRNGQSIAKLCNNILFDREMTDVLGIVIGNCFFGASGVIVGKIFNDTVYLPKGEIIGQMIADPSFNNRNLKKEHMMKAWKILSQVKDHTIPWIKETKRWDSRSLLELLRI